MLTLYDYYRSSASFRVRIALNLKALPYETIPIHLIHNGGEQHASEYKNINPHALVPSFRTEDNNILTQSLAIIEFLEETYPNPPLLPKTPYERGLVRAFALSITADIHPLNNMRVLNFLTQTLSFSDEQKKMWYQHWVIQGLTALETQLKQRKHRYDFSFAETPTLADICLIPQVYNARRFNCPIDHLEMILKIDAQCQKHPAFIKAWPNENN